MSYMVNRIRFIWKLDEKYVKVGLMMIIVKVWCYFRAILQKIFYKIIYGNKLKIGKRVTWRRGFSIMKMSDAFIQIGNDCFFNNNCSLASNTQIVIGQRTIMGENVKIYDHNHRFNKNVPIKEQGFSNKEVYIGDDCWLGSNVVILKGTHISNHCIIGAGCIISGYVPEWTIIKSSDEYKTYSIAH